MKTLQMQHSPFESLEGWFFLHEREVGKEKERTEEKSSCTEIEKKERNTSLQI